MTGDDELTAAYRGGYYDAKKLYEDEIERLRAALEHIVKIYEYQFENYDHLPSNVLLMAKVAKAALGEKD